MNFKTQNITTDGNGDAGLSVRNAQNLFAFPSVLRFSLSQKSAACTGRMQINSIVNKRRINMEDPFEFKTFCYGRCYKETTHGLSRDGQIKWCLTCATPSPVSGSERKQIDNYLEAVSIDDAVEKYCSANLM